MRFLRPRPHHERAGARPRRQGGPEPRRHARGALAPASRQPVPLQRLREPAARHRALPQRVWRAGGLRDARAAGQRHQLRRRLLQADHPQAAQEGLKGAARRPSRLHGRYGARRRAHRQTQAQPLCPRQDPLHRYVARPEGARRRGRLHLRGRTQAPLYHRRPELSAAESLRPPDPREPRPLPKRGGGDCRRRDRGGRRQGAQAHQGRLRGARAAARFYPGTR